MQRALQLGNATICLLKVSRCSFGLLLSLLADTIWFFLVVSFGFRILLNEGSQDLLGLVKAYSKAFKQKSSSDSSLRNMVSNLVFLFATTIPLPVFIYT